jgi:sugar transferase (PEP-CTERM/EpsH1 system associated)
MRILFVTPYVPSRIRVRPFNLIKSLSTMHEISLVSLICDEYERELAQDVASYCSSLELVPLTRLQAYQNCFQALLTTTPLRVAYYKSAAFAQRIQHVIHEQSIEVVHGELIKVIPALQMVAKRSNIPLLFDSVDCISSYLYQQWSSASNPLQKMFVYTELKKMRKYERQNLELCEQVVVTSARDQQFLIGLGGRLEHIQVVPNGVDIDYFASQGEPREKDSLVFCAKLDYYPNSQAIVHFCRETLPIIREQKPDIHLTIVGNNPPQAVCDLARDKCITVTGFVEDVRPFLAKASVALIPLIIAAGMQNKVLEALAMGTPTVATPHACRSLQVENGVHLLIEREPASFAKAVLKLLEDTQLAQRLSISGRQYVEQYHSWSTSANILSSLYYSLVTNANKLEVLAT